MRPRHPHTPHPPPHTHTHMSARTQRQLTHTGCGVCREIVLSKIDNIVKTWCRQVSLKKVGVRSRPAPLDPGPASPRMCVFAAPRKCRSRRRPRSAARSSHSARTALACTKRVRARCFPGGGIQSALTHSARGWCHHAGADIDTLVLVPRHVEREDFFNDLQRMLLARPEVTKLVVRCRAPAWPQAVAQTLTRLPHRPSCASAGGAGRPHAHHENGLFRHRGTGPPTRVCACAHPDARSHAGSHAASCRRADRLAACDPGPAVDSRGH